MTSYQAEATRVVKAFSEAEYWVTDVELKDCESLDALKQCVAEVAKKSKSGYMLILGNAKNQTHLVAHVPEDKHAAAGTAIDWVNAALGSMGDPAISASETNTVTTASGTLPGDPNTNRFPIKMKDTARAAVFSMLRKKGALKEESDDEGEEPAHEDL